MQMGENGAVKDPNDWKGWVVATPGVPSAARTVARAALIDSVFNSTGAIASGGACCLVIGFATAWRCASSVPIIWTLLYVATVAWRLALNKAYEREGRGQKDVERWARRYAWGALVTGGTLGVAAGLAVALDLPTALLLALAAIGSAGGVAGRNSGLPRLATVQSVLLVAPVGVGGLWSAEPANLILVPTSVGYAYALFSFTRQYYSEISALIVAQLDDAALARNDALTGIANRRLFDERLKALWPSGSAPASPLALLLIDVDYFKRYNDLYGHPAGDECLRHISVALRDLIGEDDLIARYGGEEFVVLLPGRSLERALVMGNRFCRAVVALGIEQAMRTDELEVVTISVGIGHSSTAVSAEHLIEAADRALYRAKRAGRNRVYPESAETVIALQRSSSAAPADAPLPASRSSSL
jgi:diguanylate cyclase (GGDEF)-like protein